MVQNEDACVKVDRRYGEKIRRFLIGRSMLDRTRKIVSKGTSIYIPVCRSPSSEELEEAGRIAHIDICEEKLPGCKSKANDLPGLLKDAVPASLIPKLPRSHDRVGDILLLESLSPELLPYRASIGQGLLNLNPSATTVLLKTGKVEGEFRIPRLEVIAGIEKFETVHKEHGVSIKVDLSKAYFSPRLGFERRRVATEVSEGETVVDMFAGVGPFSLMIAKKAKAKVYSIDINPEAIRLLKKNVSINRLRGEIIPICGDALKVAEKLVGIADRVVMNLPASSLEFLGAASKFLKQDGGMIHLYMFSNSPSDAETQLRHVARDVQGEFIIRNCRIVKPVAPKKWQVALDVELKKHNLTG